MNQTEQTEADIMLLIAAMLDTITEFQDMIIDLRIQVNKWHPQKPYLMDLYSDINPCFDDYIIARLYPELFAKLQ